MMETTNPIWSAQWPLSVAMFFLVSGVILARKKKKPIPGPTPLPVLGNLLSFRGADIREKLLEFGRRYGDVFSINIGPNRMVVLNSYDVIREALVTHSRSTAGRPMELFLFKEFTKGLGIATSEGALWTEHRRFLTAIFRDFGVGRPVFETKIREEVTAVLEVLRDNVGRPYDPSRLLNAALCNITHSITLGRRFHYDDPFFQHVEDLENNVKVIGAANPLTMFPWLKHVPGDLFSYKRTMASVRRLRDMYQTCINDHRSSFVHGQAPRDLIDAYLAEAEKQKDNECSTFTDPQLVHVLSNLFLAGTETSATTLSWGILLLIHHSDVMEAVHREIDDVIGTGRLPEMADRQRMPYTEAVLMEIQRFGDVGPFGMLHKTHDPLRLRGFEIPAETTIITHLHAVHRDPNIWKDPYHFRPEHFLDEQGNVRPDKRLVPFGLGRRVCLGESLARMELFLIFTSLLQHFTFRTQPGQPLPPLAGTIGLGFTPYPYRIVVEAREGAQEL